MSRIAWTVVAVAAWIAVIWGVYEWSVSGSGWAGVNAAIAAAFGLILLVPVLLRLWRD